MPLVDSHALDPNDALRIEVGCILIDPLFVRSPIQAKLLNFLCERAIDGDQDLTQYAIAVDGLGRSEDYDLQNDSYPRVQVSRLRSNLANYYSRHEPLNEHCVHIRQGDYRLRLGTRETAYPSEIKRQSALPVGGAEASAIVESEQASHFDSQRTRPFARKHLITFIVVVAATTIGLIIGFQKTRSTDLQLPPAIELMIVSDQRFSTQSETSGIEEGVARIARQQLNQSFVSNLIESSHVQEREEDYFVKIDLGGELEKSEAVISLRSSSGEVLFLTRIPFDGDADAFLRTISSNLVYLVAPNGVIAKRELSEIHGEPKSPYQCFISIEGNRTRAEVMVDLLDSCIERFPNDQFASFWYARKAYMAYQVDISAGKAVSQKSPAWKYVIQALEIDQHNAFANFVAAKVSAADKSCDMSRLFIARAMERGSSYPSLTAAAEVEASGCGAETRPAVDVERKELEALIAQNPTPDALLHLYMMIAALSVERKDLANDAAAKLVIGRAASSVERTSTLLRRSITERGYFAKHEQETREMVALFVWNERARSTIYGQLAAT